MLIKLKLRDESLDSEFLELDKYEVGAEKGTDDK